MKRVKYLTRLFSSIILKQKMSQQRCQMKSDCWNKVLQYKYIRTEMSYFKVLVHYFSNLARAKHVYLVHRFRRTKFAELNLFYLARLNLVPLVYLFLICRAKQTSQNLTCCLFSSFVYLFSSFDKVKTVNKLFTLFLWILRNF